MRTITGRLDPGPAPSGALQDEVQGWAHTGPGYERPPSPKVQVKAVLGAEVQGIVDCIM